MNTRGGIYCRISLNKGEKDDKKNPIPKVEAQEAMCRKLAEAHGISVEAVYVDDGIGAYTFRDRPGWAQMLADVQAGKLDVLLAQAEDRFTRQPMEKETLVLASVAAGVTFLTVNDGRVDPSTADGAFFSGLRALLGRMESQKMGTRKRQANAARRDRGVIPRGGPRPFGWDDDRRTLRHNEADLVRRAFVELIRGEKTPSAIATAWNRAGVLTSRGGRWDIPKVRALLMRPRNAGLVSYRGELVLDEQGNPVPPTWQPIVDEETYRTAVAILADSGPRTAKQYSPKHLCASLATCGPCGSPLRSSRNHGNTHYRCASHDGFGPTFEDVRHVSIRAEELDRIVTDAVVSGLLVAPRGSAADADTDRLRTLYSRLAEIHRGVVNLLDLVESTTFTPQQIAGKKRALDGEAERVEAEIARIAHQNARAALLAEARAELWSGSTLNLDEAAKVKTVMRHRFDRLELDQKRALIRGTVKVTVERGRGPGRVKIEHLVATSLNEDDPAA